MRASRGMGAILPSKMPKAKVKKRRDNTDFMQGGNMHPRRDNTDFTEYTQGGSVNAAGKQFVAQPKSIAKKTAGYR